MRADGSGARQITSGGFDREPVFAPTAAASRFARITHDAEIADVASTSCAPRAAGFELFKPVWSPDGRKFLAGCFDVGSQIDKLCVIQANGAAWVSLSPRQIR